MTQSEAHKKVLDLLNSKVFTQIEISELIDKTRQTTNSRVKKGDWRQKEIKIIENI